MVVGGAHLQRHLQVGACSEGRYRDWMAERGVILDGRFNIFLFSIPPKFTEIVQMKRLETAN